MLSRILEILLEPRGASEGVAEAEHEARALLRGLGIEDVGPSPCVVWRTDTMVRFSFPERSVGLFVVSMGSNIQPAGNLACALRFLLSLAGTLHLSRVIETESVGVEEGGAFLNLAVAFHVGFGAARLKRELVGYEESFGRDRRDPARKRKPRPLDLDILFEIDAGQDGVAAERIPGEPYARPVVLELLGYLGVSCPIPAPVLPRGVELDVGGLWVGDAPATLSLDPETGGPVRTERRPGGSTG